MKIAKSSSPYQWALARGVEAWASLGLFLLLVAAQISLPLTTSRVSQITSLVVVTMTALAFTLSLRAWGPRRLAATSIAVVAATIGIESLATRWGFPFGTYQYSSLLQPQIMGTPVIVGLAWLAMGLPSWELAKALTASPWLRPLATGVFLAAWDLLLDPQMTGYGFWSWDNPGSVSWFGIPLSNYFGWLVTGTLIGAFFLKVDPNPTRVNLDAVVVYVWMSFFSSLGFLLPFVFDEPIIGVVGAVATLVPALIALRRMQHQPTTRQSSGAKQ